MIKRFFPGVLALIFVRCALAVDMAQPPALVEVTLSDKTVTLNSIKIGEFNDSGVEVAVVNGVVTLKSPTAPVKKLHLHWDATFGPNAKFLGDAWERAYGDLQWKPIEKTGPMPWYFLTNDGNATVGYGVMTGPSAMCYWRVDDHGIDLFADVRSGGVGVELGDRTLTVCKITSRRAKPDENAFAATREFCRQMCPHPRKVPQPIYGFNDYFCSYNKNTAADSLADGAYICSLCPDGDNRPFMVIDDGWQAGRQGAKTRDNPWDRTNEKFGSTMPDVAAATKKMNARPGLWYRPLEAWPDAPADWRLAGHKNVLDPSNPAVLKSIATDMKRFRGWGYEMVKHDFSTYDIFNRFGSTMSDKITKDGWAFSDKTHTTSEIVLKFYQTLRDAAGDGMYINGCNTISHLSAGIFEMARVGDDTSGVEWPRTARMGVNCIAFRSAQNGTFYQADPDCVGLAKEGVIPWEKNKQWMDLLAHSGLPVFVSWPKHLIGPEQESAIREAMSIAAKPHTSAEPLDWMTTRTPVQWQSQQSVSKYSW